MLRCVVLVITDVSEESIATINKVKRISELGTLTVISCSLILFTLMMETIRSFQTSVTTRAIRWHIPEDGILHSLNREDFKSYIALTC
jgi:hypothetical protein